MISKTTTRALLCISCFFAAAPPANAQECSNAMFKGRYAVLAESEPVMGEPTAEDQWAIAGTLVADGDGLITEWKETAVRQNSDGNGTTVEERDIVAGVVAAGNRTTYAVSSDCRMRIRADFGPVAVEVNGALASGGKEVLATQTSPNGYLGNAVLKSLDPPGSDVLGSIKQTLDRVAVRMGLRP